ncbi:MAG: hypothetical protein P8172_08020 [Gammaproteobacteria bacterium]
MMATPARYGGFLGGLLAGVLVGLVGTGAVLLAGQMLGTSAPASGWTIRESLDWAWRNLGLSLPVFAAVLWLYVRSLGRLRRCIAADAPLDEVVHAENLTDTWTSLFFGVGVIWTAIGMRGALLYALGDPTVSVDDGAFVVLQRMVNGGILVALSTTIFGGIGGYLMRIVKTVLTGAALRRYYDLAARQSGDEIRATLGRIEDHLAALTGGRQEAGDERLPVDGTVAPRL